MSETIASAPEIRESLQPVACPLCGASAFRPRHRAAGYTIVDCLRCGLTHVNPQPTEADLAYFYATVFHTPGWYKRFPHLRDFDYFGDAASDAAGHQSYVALVRQQVPRGSWLDVGCGHGRLAAEAAAAGYGVFGVDPSPLAIGAARLRLGPDRVFQGSVEAAGFPPDRFTVVSMVGTIEHLKRPLETLREIHRILAPGGLLLVQTPNLASLQYRHQRENWEQFTPPGHLVYFTPRTLRAMLKSAGFRRVRFDMRFPLGAGWEYGAAAGPPPHRRPLGLLCERAAQRIKGHLIGKHDILSRLASVLGGRCVMALQRLRGRLVGKHDIVCHARKPRGGGG